MFSDPKKNIEQCGLSLGATVADFGSGSGHYARAISQVVGDKGKVYAIDIQKDLLAKLKNEATKEHFYNIEVIWGDIEKRGGTRLKDASIDMVVISNLLFQVSDKDTVASEASRVTKPGGQVLVIDWSEGSVGLGPRPDMIFDKAKAKELFLKNGFMFEKDINTGEHHYGIIFKKI
jgi:ubiquinone/menaquinone biosynthesis C-methylase UbiE